MVKSRERASQYDERQHPDVEGLLKQIPSLRGRPLVGANTLREVLKVTRVLPKLEFPVNSAGDMIAKLGGSGAMFEIEGIRLDPVRMIKYMPAYYFPIADMDNLVEKMSELIHQNRRLVDVPKELESVKRQITGILEFPISDKKTLLRMLEASKRRFEFQGRQVVTATIVERIPEDAFPIESEEQFVNKVRALMSAIPLIAPHH